MLMILLTMFLHHWLFTDEYLLYRVIKSEEVTFQLHCDRDHLLQWAQVGRLNLTLLNTQ